MQIDTKSPYYDYFSQLPSTIEYSNDEEYRKSVRTVFQFDTTKKYTYDGQLCDFDSLDPVTQDELVFDSEALTLNMEYLYKNTCECQEFAELYEHAAGRMFSTDPQIGQVVLCSFDTFREYYACLWYYFYGGLTSMTESTDYNYLKKHFSISN